MRKILVSIACLLLLTNNITKVKAEDTIDITADFAIAIDEKQGTVLYQKNADEKMYPASMTKIVTVIVALEMMDDINETTTITNQDIDTIFETGASAAFFKVGEVVTYKDLIFGAILPSGADATRALAFNLSGDLETFVKKMNDLTKTLGLKNTNFINTTGIHDDNHYTTASDLAKILQYALKNKDFKEAFCAREYKTTNGLHEWVNTGIFYPQLYRIDTNIIVGCKSGYTPEASNCLASLMNSGERDIITVVAHCDHSVRGAYMLDTNKISNYCDNNYGNVVVFKKDELIKSENVLYGKNDTKYDFISSEDIILYLPKNYDKNDLKVSLPTNLVAPIDLKTKLGNLEISYKDQLLYQKDLSSNKAITKDNFKYYLNEIMKKIVPIIIGVLLIVLLIILIIKRSKKIYNLK